MVLLRMGARIEDGSDYGIYHGDKDEDNVVEDGVKLSSEDSGENEVCERRQPNGGHWTKNLGE